MKKIILCVLAIALAVGAGAQSKAEIKLYQKTIAKPSVKAYDKFLQKYPSSVYAPQLTYSKDSLQFISLNKTDEKALEAFIANNKTAFFSEQAQKLLKGLRTSNLTKEEIDAAAEQFIAPNEPYCAAAYRKYGQDYIVIASLPAGSTQVAFLIIRTSSEGWAIEKFFNHERNTMMTVNATEFVDDVALCTIPSSDSQYFRFAYVNRDHSAAKVEYVLNLLDYENENLYSAIFYGNNLLQNGGTTYRIEGQSPESMTGGLLIPEQLYLNAALKENPDLVQISSEDAWTDEAITWWLEKNPNAQTSASSLSFGILKEECGIVKKFQKQKKESSAGYSAALFDIRGYTVVCAKNAGQYVLVWCEPVAKNKKTDRLLNSIYFEKGSTLCLFYYKGKTTFKYRVNLANKSLKR